MSIESKEERQFLSSNTLKGFDLQKVQRIALATENIVEDVDKTDTLLEKIQETKIVIKKDNKIQTRVTGTVEEKEQKLNSLIEKIISNQGLSTKEQELLFNMYQENEQKRQIIFNFYQRPTVSPSMFPYFKAAGQIDPNQPGGIKMGLLKLGNITLSVIKGGAASWVVGNIFIPSVTSFVGALGVQSVASAIGTRTFTDSASYFTYGVFSSNDKNWNARVFSGSKFVVSNVTGIFTGVIVSAFGGGILATIAGRTVLQFSASVIMGTVEAKFFPGKQKEQLAASALIQKNKEFLYRQEIIKQLDSGVSVAQLRRSRLLKLRKFLIDQSETTKAILFLGLASFSSMAVISAWNTLGIMPVSLGFIIDRFNIRNALHYRFLAPIIIGIVQMSGVAQMMVNITFSTIKKAGKLVLTVEQGKAIKGLLTRELVFNLSLAKIIEQFGTIGINVTLQTGITQPNLFIDKIVNFMEEGKGNIESITGFSTDAFTFANTEVAKELQEGLIKDPIPSEYDELFQVVADDQSPAIDLEYNNYVGKIAELTRTRDNLFSDLEGMNSQFRKIIEEKDIYSKNSSILRKISSLEKEYKNVFNTARVIENQIGGFEKELENVTQQLSEQTLSTEKANEMKQLFTSQKEFDKISKTIFEFKKSILAVQGSHNELNAARWKLFTISKQTLLARIEKTEFFREQETFVEYMHQQISQSENPAFVRRMETILERINFNNNAVKALASNHENFKDMLKQSNAVLGLLDKRMSAKELSGVRNLEGGAKSFSAQFSSEMSGVQNRVGTMEKSLTRFISDGKLTEDEMRLFTNEQDLIRQQLAQAANFQRTQGVKIIQFQNALFNLYVDKVGLNPELSHQEIINNVSASLMSRLDRFLPHLNPSTLSKYNLNGIKGKFDEAITLAQSPAFDISEAEGINKLVSDVADSLSPESAKIFVDAVDNLLKNSNPNDSIRSVAGFVPLVSGGAAIGGTAASLYFPATSVLGATAKTVGGILGLSGIASGFGTSIVPNVITSESVLNLFNEETDKLIFGVANSLRNGVPTFDRSVVTVLAFQDGFSPSVLRSIFEGELLTALRNGIEKSSAFSMMFWGEDLAPKIRDFFDGADPAAETVSAVFGGTERVASIFSETVQFASNMFS